MNCLLFTILSHYVIFFVFVRAGLILASGWAAFPHFGYAYIENTSITFLLAPCFLLVVCLPSLHWTCITFGSSQSLKQHLVTELKLKAVLHQATTTLT